MNCEIDYEVMFIPDDLKEKHSHPKDKLSTIMIVHEILPWTQLQKDAWTLLIDGQFCC